MRKQQTLYLMLGYPGAGKTITAKIISELTGAIHLWADKIRRKRFGTPTYSHQENVKLYTYLNDMTNKLLASGQSVVYDTNFNFYRDRQHMRTIAAKHNAQTLVVWVRTPKQLAKFRATQGAHMQDTRLLGDMSADQFERMAKNLQEPLSDETVVQLDGTKVTKTTVASLLRVTC